MKNPVKTQYLNLFRPFSGLGQLKVSKISNLVLMLAALPFVSRADGNWTGSAADNNWDNLSNWGANPSGAKAAVNITANLPIITSDNTTIVPNDINVADADGTTGRIDVRSGTLNYIYWSKIGDYSGNGTLNIADTSSSGGTLTGYGLGSGSYISANAAGNANLFVGLWQSTGVINMNTTGSLDTQNLLVSPNAPTGSGTFNLDNGTVNVSAEIQIGSSFWGQGSAPGYFNMSGGTVNANNVSISRGSSAASTIPGRLNLTGGTMNANTSFTLGFAGSATASAVVTNNGGTINVNTLGGGNMEMTVWDFVPSTFTMNSGALTLQNSASMQFGVLGSGAVATFNHNNGTVTFYSDAGMTAGGSGGIVLGSQGVNPWEISYGTFTYNLNGGTLTVPSISKTSPNASGTFNFNGGTLKAAGYTGTFMEGLTAANIQGGGAKIDTDGYDVTIGQALSGTGVLTKLGAGTLALSGTNTHTGDTVISNGVLALSGTGTLASQVIITSGNTFDVSALSVGIQNPISGLGAVSGNATSAAGMAIYPATNGTAGTLTFNNDLNMDAGGSMNLDLSTVYNSGNDQVVVSGNLTVSSATTIRIKALGGAAALSTVADYVLCSVAGTTIWNSAPALAWDGTTPANYLSYSIQQSGNDLVLHYTPATAPTVTATSTPAVVSRNQAVTVAATVTPGSGTVTSVKIDAVSIGGSATADLYQSATPNVWTNTFVVGSSIVPGVKVMTVVATDTTPLNSPGYTVTNTVVITNEVWTGVAANNNWTSANWHNAVPATSGDAVTFAGSTRTMPNMDANFSVTGVTFSNNASSFNIGTDNGSTLTLTANGVVNNSANAQTLNVPITMSGAQTFNANVGNLILVQTITSGNSLITVTGAANTVISSPVSGSGSLFKKGGGALTLSGSSYWDLAQASSGGFSGPLIAQAGTLVFNNGSYQAVNGELVIGGVATTNGGTGNNAKLVVDNATLNVSTWLSVGRGNGVGTVSSDLIVTNGGAVSAQDVSAGYNANNTNNLPKASITLSDTSSLTVSGGNLHVGESDGSDVTLNVNGTATVTASSATMNVGINSGKGAVNVNGGSVSVGLLRVGSGSSADSTAQGTVTVNTGTFSCEGDVMLGFAGSSADLGKLVINGGTFNIATASKRWFIMNQYDTCASQLDVNGGSLNLNAETDIRFAIGNNTGSNTINLNSGAITFYSDNATTVGGSGVLDLHYGNGATVQNTFNLNGGTLSVSNILAANTAGTSTFNFNGGTLKPTATTATFLQGLSAAGVKSGGAIIDTAGFDVTIAQALVNNGVDADGGLTKNGNGILTLTGANTYTNNTTVNAGTLALSQPALSSVGTVTIASGAMLQLDFPNTVTNQVKALVLGGSSQAPGVYNASTSPSFISGTGNLVVPSPINPNPPQVQVSVSGNAMTIAWPTNAGWILQSNSVSLSNGSAWFNYPANGAVDVTSVNITIDPAKTNVFYRMVKPE
jgi:autotransporter-associated beta strand protein